MPNPQTSYLNKEAMLRGAHSVFAAVAPTSYPDELLTLAKVARADRTSEQTLRIAQLLHETFEALDWKNCGALDDGKISAENKVVTREHQNVMDTKAVNDQTVKYTAKMLESTNPVVEPILACGLKTFVNVPGTAVSGATMVIPSGFIYGKGYKIPNQNADGTAPTIATVVGSVDGALTVNDDYVLQPNGDGSFSIVPFHNASGSSAITTTAQTITITYGYTPTAYRMVGEGGITELTYITLKVLMVESTGKARWWIIPKCVSTKGFELAATKYNDDKADIGIEVEVDGELDLSLPAGFQDFWRHDEVNAA